MTASARKRPGPKPRESADEEAATRLLDELRRLHDERYDLDARMARLTLEARDLGLTNARIGGALGLTNAAVSFRIKAARKTIEGLTPDDTID